MFIAMTILCFKVPFIAFYRKEYVDPELNINDLWRIFQWDEKVKFYLNFKLYIYSI